MGHIWLIGLMGSGKSAVGAALAERTGRPFYDVDARVEASYGRSVSDIFFIEGEEAFRTLESDALRTIAAEPDGIVATGGGSILAADNIGTMRASGTVVLLEVTAQTAAARITESASRPLLNGDSLEMLSDMLAARAGRYRAAAAIVVDANDSVDAVADAVEAACDM
jgi:shikimate kinase